LLRCFQEDARALGLNLRVIATDSNAELSAACKIADLSFTVPRCDSPNYVGSLLEICAAHKIALLIPTIDTELELLSNAEEEFLKIGTRVAISTRNVVSICRDKARTAAHLASQKIPVPRTIPIDELRLDISELAYPLLLKPRAGSSSKGLYKVDSEEELRNHCRFLRNYVAQELFSGPEYTVNMFFDHARRLRCAIPHLRIETRSGEVSKGRTEANPALLELASKIGEALPGAFGALCFQAILTASHPVVFEINARFGGGYPLAHHAGGRFSKWLLEWAFGLPTSISSEWKDGLTMLRFDQSVFF